jgi:Ni/Co efflux regulator RcnB
MKRLLSTALAFTLLVGTTDFAAAAPSQNSSYRSSTQSQGRYGHYDRDRRPTYREGQRVQRQEWNRWDRANWRRAHLRRPGRGYEWRQVDGRFIEIAIATGLIIAIVSSR